MDQTRELRAHLRRILDWEDAHVSFDDAVADVQPRYRGVAPAGLPHTLWQLVEHIRLTQFDILDFCTNAAYVERSMEEHWPTAPAPPAADAWSASLAQYRRDLESMRQLAADDRLDLLGRIPQGTGQTFLRAVLLVADHTAYHVGQIVLVRRALGIWPPA